MHQLLRFLCSLSDSYSAPALQAVPSLEADLVPCRDNQLLGRMEHTEKDLGVQRPQPSVFTTFYTDTVAPSEMRMRLVGRAEGGLNKECEDGFLCTC